MNRKAKKKAKEKAREFSIKNLKKIKRADGLVMENVKKYTFRDLIDACTARYPARLCYTVVGGEDEDGAYHHRRKGPVEQFAALPLDQSAHHKVDKRHAGESGYGSGESPLLGGGYDRGDKGKRAAQKDRHAPLGDNMEDEGAHTGGEECRGGINANKKGYQHCSTKVYEEKLHTHDGLLGRR